ncbi:hypothetical protein Tco_1047495 [Tanacetum coccineum]
MFIEQSHDEVYGCLKGGSRNSGGRRLAISMVEEAWLSEKEEVPQRKPKLGLWYPRVSSFDLEAYSDSDYAGANLNRKSTTKGCQFLGRRLILWQCKKQTIVATSTTEAEYVAAANYRG